MKLAIALILLLQVLLIAFFLGVYQGTLEKAYQAGVDSVPKVVQPTIDPAQWWFGVEDKTKAKTLLCGKR